MEGRRSFLVGVSIAIVTALQGCGGGAPTPAPAPVAPTPPPGPTTPAPPTQPPKEAAPDGAGIGVYVYDHLIEAAGATFKVYTGRPTLGGWVQRPEAEGKFEDWDINDVRSFSKRDDSAHGGLKVPGAGEMKMEWSNGKICTLKYSSDGRKGGVCTASTDCGNSATGVKAVLPVVDANTCATVSFSMNVVPDPNAGPVTPAPATSPAPPAGPTSPPAPSGAGIGVYVWDHLHNDPGATFKIHTGAPSTGSWVSRPAQTPRDWGIKDTRSFYKVDEGAHGGLAVPGAGTMQLEWTSSGLAGKNCTLTYSSDGKADGACSASTDCGKNGAGVAVVSASVDSTTCQSITFSVDVAPPSPAVTEAFAV